MMENIEEVVEYILRSWWPSGLLAIEERREPWGVPILTDEVISKSSKPDIKQTRRPGRLQVDRKGQFVSGYGTCILNIGCKVVGGHRAFEQVRGRNGGGQVATEIVTPPRKGTSMINSYQWSDDTTVGLMR
jgi:hypothetical protein